MHRRPGNLAGDAFFLRIPGHRFGCDTVRNQRVQSRSIHVLMISTETVGTLQVIIMGPFRLRRHTPFQPATLLLLFFLLTAGRLAAQVPAGTEFLVTLPAVMTTAERNDTSFKFRLQIQCSRET